MSLSSDTEGPPPGALQPTLPQRINPDIREEEGKEYPTPSSSSNSSHTFCLCGNGKGELDIAKSSGQEVDSEERRVDKKAEQDSYSATQGNPVPIQTVCITEATAGLNYDSVKYTLVVDENAQLELVSLKDCFPSYNKCNDDSDAETVYQSANEEEDPEYVQERKRRDEQRKQGNEEDSGKAWTGLCLQGT